MHHWRLKLFEPGHLLPGIVPRLLLQKDAVAKLRGRGRKKKSEASFNLCKTLRNYVTQLINKARTEYYTDLIDKNSDNQGMLFRVAKTLLHTKTEPCFPNFPNDTMVSNAFGDFFVRKISKIGTKIDAVVLNQFAVDMVPGDVKSPADKLSALTSFWWGCSSVAEQTSQKLLHLRSNADDFASRLSWWGTASYFLPRQFLSGSWVFSNGLEGCFS